MTGRLPPERRPWLAERFGAWTLPFVAWLLVQPEPLRPWPGWTMNAPHRRGDALAEARHHLYDRLRRQCSEWWTTLPWVEGLGIRLNLLNDLGWSLLMTGAYEPNEVAYVRQSLPRGGVFVDVGANEGVFTIVASLAVGKTGRVVAIEPSPREVARLRSNVALNRQSNVTILESALGSQAGSTRLLVADPAHAGHNTFGSFAYPEVHQVDERHVDVTTLDAVVEREGLGRVDTIKIDVEGAELEVLKGGRRTLERHRPAVVLELNELTLVRQGTSSAEILDLLSQLGYVALGFGEASGLPTAGEPLTPNVVCLPANQA